MNDRPTPRGAAYRPDPANVQAGYDRIIEHMRRTGLSLREALRDLERRVGTK
jgi:hypothetical protein